MEINRNQYFMIGVVLIILGLQLRVVDHYILNQKTSQKLAERSAKKSGANPLDQITSTAGLSPRKVVRPPEWSGWAIISVGAVLVLHSLAMKKPEG